jgi:hypothetical protein
MTASTYTSTVFNASPKGHHIGNLTVSGQGQWTAGGSVTDVLFLAKVPHGAKIVDFYEFHSNGQTAAVLDFGFDRGIASGGAGNLSCLVSGGALATMNRLSLAAAPSNTPVTISLSDLDPVRYAVLACKAISGTFTITVSVNFCLTYRFDGPDVA